MGLYCFTSLSAQSCQYPTEGSPSLGLYALLLSVLYYAQYNRQHRILWAFELFGTLYIHNPDDKYPTRAGFETSISEFRATIDLNEQ